VNVLLASLFGLISADENITGDGWKYYCVGDCVDIKTKSIGGTVNMGGGEDVADAFKWIIKRSGGGDILVLRTGDYADYNEWIYGLGPVNSVSTLVLLDANASNDEFVYSTIMNCEGLWFAGGDQWKYYSFWKNTMVQKSCSSYNSKSHYWRNKCRDGNYG